MGGWENRCAIDVLQRGENRGEQTENRQRRCGVSRRLNTALSTGWAEGCSLFSRDTPSLPPRMIRKTNGEKTLQFIETQNKPCSKIFQNKIPLKMSLAQSPLLQK